jgi:hypothetical protein
MSAVYWSASICAWRPKNRAYARNFGNRCGPTRKQFSWLKIGRLRLFITTLPCSIWGQFYFLNTISSALSRDEGGHMGGDHVATVHSAKLPLAILKLLALSCRASFVRRGWKFALLKFAARLSFSL